MTMPAYGITFNRQSDGPRPSQPSDLSVIGIALPADDADASFLPLNEPVAFDSGDPAALGKLGNSELANAVSAIDHQLADMQGSARVIVVRVPGGDNEAETIANIVGANNGVTAIGNVGTGLYAFLRAGSKLGVIPRLLGAPNYTSQIQQGGTGNAICAALPGICSKLLAHAVVAGPNDPVEAVNWFESLASGRLIPIAGGVKVAAGIGSRDEDGAAHVLGMGARTDFKHRGYPFWSFAGQQVQGIVGLDRTFTFSLVDGATEGQELLAHKIGVFARGEAGVETAAASNGFQFTGLWNADTDPDWWFYNKSRARDWAHLGLLKSIRLRLGNENVTRHSIQAVLNDCIVIGQDMMQNGGSIGFRVGFEEGANSPTNLRQGKFRIFFQNEEPAPIARVDVDSRPYFGALEIELQKIIAQATTLVPQYL